MHVAVLTLITAFLASAVEAIEMVTIVVGVGATRGWRSVWFGTVSGFAVLAVVIGIAGAALSGVPIGALRLVVGSLLLVFGLQWFRKGIRRVAARGFAGIGEEHFEGQEWKGPRMDWTAFVLAFKGVFLEGLEVAFIVVSFGASGAGLVPAIIGGVGAVVVVGGLGLSVRGAVERIPRSVLQLIVGIMLTTFGTFWALEGLGVDWPLGDGAIVGLLILYFLTAMGYISLERRRAFGLQPGV